MGFRNKVCKYDPGFKCITLVDCDKCQKEDYFWAIKWKEQIWQDNSLFSNPEIESVKEANNGTND